MPTCISDVKLKHKEMFGCLAVPTVTHIGSGRLKLCRICHASSILLSSRVCVAVKDYCSKCTREPEYKPVEQNKAGKSTKCGVHPTCFGSADKWRIAL